MLSHFGFQDDWQWRRAHTRIHYRSAPSQWHVQAGDCTAAAGRSLSCPQPHANRTMTSHSANSDSPSGRPLACIRIGNGDYVIYDQQNPITWIQSDTTYPLPRTN